MFFIVDFCRDGARGRLVTPYHICHRFCLSTLSVVPRRRVGQGDGTNTLSPGANPSETMFMVVPPPGSHESAQLLVETSDQRVSSRSGSHVICVIALSAWAFLGFWTTGHAEDASAPSGGIVIGSPSGQVRSSEGPCVDVQIGDETTRSLDCLNKKLKSRVNRVQPTTPKAPFNAQSQDIQVGVTNESAIRQQYGTNFGTSPFPQRPAAPTFVSPGGRH